MYNLIVILACFIIPFIILRKKIKEAIVEKKSIKNFLCENKYEIMICIILVVGCLVRLVAITDYPAGFNQDEASAGYEAFSVFKYGVDRHNKSFPVHFIAWGSGQNVLYSYMMIPFIALLGLSELSVRLPMAILGCVTLILVYKLFNQYNKKLTLVGLAFFAICPWHIMKSRWGLESNIFPDMVFIAIYILLMGIKNKKMLMFYIGMAVLSFSVYSYGTSYAFLPIFIILLLLYLLITKTINWKNAIISLIIVGIIALPMMLFVMINSLGLEEIRLGFITIPREYQNRYEQVTGIFSADFVKTAWTNFKYNLRVLLHQTDGTNYNCVEFFGLTYIFSLPFTILGIFSCIKKKSIEKNILNIWFIASMCLLIICEKANINRLNIIMIPLVLYTILGIYEIIKSNKKTIIPIVATYTIAFCMFGLKYVDTQGNKNSTFAQDLQQPIQYVESLDVDKVYITYSFAQPYIYTLFYTQSPVDEFVNTVTYKKANVAFETIKSFGKYYFYIPENMDEDNVAYVVLNNFEYDKDKFDVIDFGRYIVLENKQ